VIEGDWRGSEDKKRRRQGDEENRQVMGKERKMKGRMRRRLSESMHATVLVCGTGEASLQCHGWLNVFSLERERKRERERVKRRKARKEGIRDVFHSCGFINFCYGSRYKEHLLSLLYERLITKADMR